MENKSIRELTSEDTRYVVDYFHGGSEEFLWNMGVDKRKLPPRSEWEEMIIDDLSNPMEERKFYYLLWLIDELPVGHCNINHIHYGEEANMHLHMWDEAHRKSGGGSFFVTLCIAQFFEKFGLKRIICEPNSKNTAPNRTLEKLGFTFVKKHEKIPGFINYFQELNRWELDRDTFMGEKSTNLRQAF